MSGYRWIVDRLYAAFNARRFEAYAELLDENVLLVINGSSLRGVAAVSEVLAAALRESPGVRVALERVLAEDGDTIVTRTRYVDASVAGSEPAAWGAWALPVTLCEVYRVAGGRIVEWRDYVAERAEQPSSGNVAPWPGTARLVAEQAALRRVATLVTGGAGQVEVFDTIVSEAAGLFDRETWLCRFDADETGRVVAAHGTGGAGGLPGGAYSLVGDGIWARVARTGRPARADGYAGLTGPGPDDGRRLGITAWAAAPLIVRSMVWGALQVVSRGAPLPVGIEERLAQFADLAAAAIGNAQSRAELRSLADEQTALRRVAELAARGSAIQNVFERVTAEASRLLDDTPMALYRYERSGAAVIVAQHMADLPVGGRMPITGDNLPARVWRTGRAARIDNDYQAVAVVAPRWIQAGVVVPIVVEGRLWGVLGAGSTSSLPAGTEERLTRFGELVAAAIANAESQDALRTSRARIVTSGDEARRRLARDVHDGAQQRQVHTVIALKQAQAALHDTGSPAAGLIEESLRQAQAATAALRDLAHGIMPAALHRGGLRAGIDSLKDHVSLPLQAEVLAERLPEPVETTAYFVAAEALTNVAKHADAQRARVRAFLVDDRLQVVVSDDGHGGADPAGGTGLVGLADRVAAVGGTMSLSSPPGEGTTLSVALPINQPTGGNDPDTAAVRPDRS